MVVRDSKKGRWGLVAVVLLAFATGAAVMYFGHQHVLDMIRGLFR